MKTWLQSTSGLQDTSIRDKLLIAPAILILALALITGLAMYGLNVQAEALNQVNEITLEQIKRIDQFSLLSEQVQSDVYQLAVLRLMEVPEAETQPVQARLEQGVNELKILYGEITTRWPPDESERTILERMKIHLDDFTLQAQQAAQSVTENPSFGVLMVRSSTLSYTQFSETLAELLDYKDSKISRTQMEMVQKTAALKATIITLVLLMALAGIMMNLFISARLIVRPIQETTHLMGRLADNDLSIEVLGLERQDEIGAMARAVEVFRDNAIAKGRLDEELRESEQRLVLAQEIAHVGNWELDLASSTIWASSEAFRIYGLERKSPYLSLADAQKVPVREDRPRLDAALSALLQKQSPYDVEFRVMRSGEKTPRVIHSQANLICDEADTPVKVIGVIQDITERKRAEEKILELNAELEQRVAERTHELREAQEKIVRQERLAVLGQLAGGIGHELRNPLGVISNAIYYLNMVMPDANEEVREGLALIQDNTQEAAQIVSDLLDFSRVKSVDRSVVNVSEIIEVIFSQHPAPKNVTIDMDIPDDLPPAHVDQLHIKQILTNLVTNAFQAMPDGGRLTLAARVIEELIEISITDTGVGISPENMDKIFEPLFTTKSRGIGLGLAICKNLTEANGGQLLVKSVQGQGSTFCLYLPVMMDKGLKKYGGR